MAVMHPCLYIAVGELGLEYIASPAAFVLHTVDEAAVRGVKACIQANDAGLDLRRLHVYVVADSCVDVGLLSHGAAMLRRQLLGDFPSVGLYLCVMLWGAGNGADLASAAPLYDRCYLLCDRNEYGEVNQASRKASLLLLNYLPLTHQPSSQFDEVLSAKSMSEKRPLYVSAGYARLEKPHDAIYAAIRYAVQVRLAEDLEAVLGDAVVLDYCGEGAGGYAEPELDAVLEKIVRDIASVPSRPVPGRSLRGLTIQAAEAQLCGDAAARFYEANYEHYAKLDESGRLLIAPTQTSNGDVGAISNRPHHCEALNPATLIQETHRLSIAISSLSKAITHHTHQLSNKYKTKWQGWFFQKPIKIKIGEAYAIRCKLDRLQQAHTQLTAQYNQTQTYIKNIRQLISNLKSAPPTAQETHYTQAANTILSDISANALISQIPIRQLTAPDNDIAAAQAIDHFIQAEIIRHPTIALSFEEDLHIRARLAGHQSLEAYILDILTQLHKKAALAVSLQRQDGLIHENFLCCPAALTDKAQAYPWLNRTVTHFIEDAAGITMLRLIGGFAYEDVIKT